MKCERFIKEYANYRKKYIREWLNTETIKNKECERIDKIIKLRERGLISPEEAINAIQRRR